MTIEILYEYERENGGTTVSPIEPEVPYTICYRLIADEGMAVTLDNIDLYPVVDVDSVEGWHEVEMPEEENEEEILEPIDE